MLTDGNYKPGSVKMGYYALRFLFVNIYHKEWAVNIQPPMSKPEKVLEYLSRYVFRITITNRRIIEVKDGKVLFWWKNYRSGLFGKMSLEIDEFIHRFLLHVLPKGFFSFGIMESFRAGIGSKI